MSKLKNFYLSHKQIILYLLFGVVTTAVSLLACFITLKVGVLFLHDENGEPTKLLDVLGSTSQWIFGVLCAFVTNKKWVFTDAAGGAENTVKQLLKFSGSRIMTYFLEVAINLAAIALLTAVGYRPFTVFSIEISERIWAKIISSVIVVISNYFISKLIVFRKKELKSNTRN